MSNLPAHYRRAEDLLDQAEALSQLMTSAADRALILALAGVGHAQLALVQPSIAAAAQNERDRGETGRAR